MKQRSKLVRTNAWLPLLLLLAAHPQAASTQTAPSRQDSLAAVLTRAANLNWYVRVLSSDSTTLTGRVQDVSNSVVRIGGESIELRLIDRSDRRVRTRSGARKGAMIGAGLSLLIAIPLSEFASDPDSGGSQAEATRVLLMAPLFGALVGFLSGEAVNPGREHWEPIWR
jgi:hypothetical protein